MIRSLLRRASHVALGCSALLGSGVLAPNAYSQAALRLSDEQLPPGFVEDFALAEDRGATLERLLAGTEPHYYYSCLHLQQQGRLDEVDALMRRWREDGSRRPSFKQVETRQALLRASTDPEATFRFLEKELGLRFNDRRVIPGASPDFPTSLDPERVSTAALLKKALARNSKGALQALDSATLETLVRRPLTTQQTRWLLDLLPRPDVPGLMELVLSDLGASKSHQFGNRKIHEKLTLDQLMQMGMGRPSVMANQKYVDAVMKRLAPRFPESMDRPEDRLAYLERAEAFVLTLPGSFTSLKAHIFYNRLQFDLDRGVVDERRLMEYLRIPRATRYYVKPRGRTVQPASLGDSFGSVTPFGAIGSEEETITACLHEVFKSSTSYERFVGVLEENYVIRAFATARLLYGAGEEAEAMVELLGRRQAESLRERVDIDFARTNGKDFGAAEDVSLAVDVKNVKRMLVKVFEIDPVAYFDRFGTAVSSALDLDGLVANDTQVMNFDAPPMARVRRIIALAALSKPGTYVVELIGGGVSSRAVIVKGNLQLLERPTAAGHALLVLDEQGQPAKDAILRFGGRDYLPQEDGTISVPYTPAPGSKRVLLRSGGVSTVANFQHGGERYALGAAVHTPLEGLLAGMSARILVRPSLMLNQMRVSVSALDSASLVITATTQDGTMSREILDGLELQDGRDFAHGIRIPERVASLSVQLTGTIRSMTDGSDLSVESKVVRFPVNSEHRESPFRAFLTETPSGYSVDLLGRAGEPVADRAVRLEFANSAVGYSERVQLKSDGAGRIQLGGLRDISSVRLISPVGDSWTLARRGALGLPSLLHMDAGGELRVPVSIRGAQVERLDASLVEVDPWGGALRDCFESLSHGNGYLTVKGLSEGTYSLGLKATGRFVRIQVLKSSVLFGHLVGEDYALDQTDAVPLQIAGISKVGDALAIQLGGVSPSARVHVVATRYLQPTTALGGLAHRRKASVGSTQFGGMFSTYESGREISDEYRYILDRRLIDPYPGNMLQRPGYLLNPWVLRATSDLMGLGGSYGGKYGGRRNLRAAGGVADSNADSPFDAAGKRSFAVPDFLGSAAVMLTNLRPNKAGVVRIPIADLGDRHMLQIVALDDTVTVEERLTRGEAELALRERRLVDALDAAKPMTQQRRIEFLSAGETFDIRDAPNAGAKTFGSLGDVFDLYRTSGAGGQELAEFTFLRSWPSLDAEEKLAKYSEFACHELHVFLKRKDPAFFASIVVPHLSSKGHATFMDDWLLDRDLSGYLEPWRFEQLNIVETILLLRDADAGARRIAEDQLALLSPSAFSMDRLFGEILAVRGLRAGQSNLTAALVETRKDARQRKLSKPGGLGGGQGGPSTPGPAGPSSVQSSSDDFFLGRGEADSRAAGREIAALEESVPMEDFEAADKNEADIELSLGSSPALAQRKQAEAFYFRDLKDTQEFAETHYWRVPLGSMGRELITVSPFWADLARAGSGPFASTSFPLANRSVTEKLLALAFLDLPFEGAEADVAAEGRSVTLTAKAPMFLALEDIAPAAREEGGPSLLVGQDFFDPTRRSETVDGVTRDLFVTGEFLRGRIYGCRMVVTNPSSIRVDAELLVQIPEGAIALGDTQMTKGIPVSLGSYGTRSLETLFYFPANGGFRDYPVHAGEGKLLLGAAAAQTLTVVDELSEIDKSTWEWISQNAEEPALLEYLERSNVRAIDLDKIAWRMGQKNSFVAITDALAVRGVFPDRLWRYAIQHRDSARAARYLAGHDSLVSQVGAPFASPLLTLEPRRRGWYEHLAYEPLVNGRVHEFSGERKILNAQFAQQYRRFLDILSLDPEPSEAAGLELAYYLLLQDRIGEAIGIYDAIDPAQLRERVQYDYMTAYMAFFKSDVASARRVAQGYVDYPVDLWRLRFRNVLAQADEIEGAEPGEIDPDNRDQSQGALAAAEPLIAIDVMGGEVRMSVEGVKEVELRYHRMDVEFLFSNSPFVRGGQGAFGVIQPTRVERLAAEGKTALTASIPEELRTANLVIEVRGGGISRQATYFAGDLSVQGMERYGQVRVLDSVGGKALSRAYVKVYALLEDGKTRFHKDGYTDLRGRFDYVSLSGVTGSKAARYAVLVMHEGSGAAMLELAAPAR